MGNLCWAFTMLVVILLPLGAGAADCGSEDTAETRAMVERINQRYDDFFRRQRELDETDQRRERDSQEIKATRLDHSRQVELTRQEYVKNRKITVVDPRLERDWLAEDKAWKDQIKNSRRCYAERKRALEAIERRGRRIPGNLEFGLEE